MTLDEQLATLEKNGIRLRDGFTVDDLLAQHERDEFEAVPYVLLLCAMGSEHDADPTRGYLSDDVWYFDAECIEGVGSYAAIVRRIAALTGGAMRIDGARDSFDSGSGTALIEVTLDGFAMQYTARLDDDWIDGGSLMWLDGLVQSVCGNRRLALHDLGGQDAVLACLSRKQVDRLRNATGLAWAWLSRGV